MTVMLMKKNVIASVVNVKKSVRRRQSFARRNN
jgi:hypothetical protein